MTTEKFEKIIEQLNIIKPYCISWGCGDEFSGYSQEVEVEGIRVVPLICDRVVFGFHHERTVYYRTKDLNALRTAKLYASHGYIKLQEM